MNEEEKIESSQEDSKPLSSEKVNETNSPEPVIEQTGPSIINDQQSTETMEVHHPHHVTHKKKWGEYLLEFFMLFLAVFLGFVAENIREEVGERHKEKEYIRSMIKDLKTDTSKIAANQKEYKLKINKLDTLMASFDSIDNGFSLRILVLLDGATSYYPDFIYTDGTIQQLKNAGGFRLIENKNAVDSIMAYDAQVKKALLNENELNGEQRAVELAMDELISYQEVGKIFRKEFKLGKKFQEFQDVKFEGILKYDPSAKDRLFNKIFDYRSLMYALMNEDYKSVKQKAASLIIFLQKEYHLQNQ